MPLCPECTAASWARPPSLRVIHVAVRDQRRSARACSRPCLPCRRAGTMPPRSGTMRKMPRSLRFYVAASTLYAAAVFLAVQYIYTIELAGSGLVVARRDTGDVLASIQLVSFVVWLGISLIAAVIMHRLASALAGARSAERQKDDELGRRAAARLARTARRRPAAREREARRPDTRQRAGARDHGAVRRRVDP